MIQRLSCVQDPADRCRAQGSVVVLSGYLSLHQATGAYARSVAEVGGKVSWILPTKVPRMRIKDVRNHIVMFDEKHTGRPKRVLYKGRVFNSIRALARAYKVSHQQVSRWVNEGRVKTL
jgi:hypothetical protein